MTLSTYVTTAYLPLRIAVSDEYGNALCRVTRRLDDWAGKSVGLMELSESLVASYLSMRSKQVGPVTVNNERRQILSLWEAAADDGLCPAPRRKRLKRLREPESDPRAWTVEQVALLIHAASKQPGVLDGVSWGDWWASLFAVVYCTGARPWSLIQTRQDAYEVGRGAVLRESKTGKTRWHDLPAWCCRLIDRAAKPRRELLWPWAAHRRTFFKRARRIVEAAGLPCPKTGRMLFYRLKRTCLSYCARSSLTLAQETAGHSSPRITERYIDRSIAPRDSAADVLPIPKIA